MARGKRCPYCAGSLWAKSECDYPAGTEVVYECPNRQCGHREKVFEDRR